MEEAKKSILLSLYFVIASLQVGMAQQTESSKTSKPDDTHEHIEKSEIETKFSTYLVGLDLKHIGQSEFSVDDFKPQEQDFHFLCKNGLPANARIRLVMDDFRFTEKKWMESCWDFLGAELSGNGKLEVEQSMAHDFFIRMKNRLNPVREHDFVMFTLKVAEAISPGTTIKLKLKGTPGEGFNAPYMGFMQFELAPPATEKFQHFGQNFIFKVMPGKPTNIEIRSKAMPDNNGQLSMSIFMTDKYTNQVTTPYKGKIRIIGHGKFSNLPSSLNWDIARKGVIQLNGIKLKGDKPARIEVIDETTGFKMLSQAILPNSIHKMNHYFGEIHFHSKYSVDGGRLTSEAIYYARDVLKLDVLSLSDHPTGSPADWRALLEHAEYNQEPGKFVMINGWEVGGNNGHVNVYIRNPKSSVSWNDANHDWENVSKFNEPKDIITAPHGTMSPKHPKFDWTNVGSRMRLAEIVQHRGCSETNVEDKLWGINPDPNKPDGSLRTALDKGHRIGFVAGTDNHIGFPTRSHISAGYIGLTGFVSDKLEQEAIWDAMDGRHTYATSGVPIICDFRVNGKLMGSEIEVKNGESVKFEAKLYGTSIIKLVEIISDGKVIKSYTPNKMDVEIHDNLGVAQKNSYYYLRVLQADGHRAWASPVWIDLDKFYYQIKN